MAVILAVDPGVRGGFCLGRVDGGRLIVVEAGELPRLQVPFRGWRKNRTAPAIGPLLDRAVAAAAPAPALIVVEAAWARPRQSVTALWVQACEYASLFGQALEAVRHASVCPHLRSVAPLHWISWYNVRAADSGKAGIAAAVQTRFPEVDLAQWARGPRGGLVTGVSDAIGLFGYAAAHYEQLVQRRD